jgi:hypothetical protein
MQILRFARDDNVKRKAKTQSSEGVLEGFGGGEGAEGVDFAGDAAGLAVAGGFQIVARLKIDPEFRSGAE